ncbi:CsgG/HfaB family protein [Leptospira paudalimensis]|uniref:CsgG/HfaB family protein n=1 Tax=Leptospira paudalimensis TaxID=2950024 RepID=A0ABT3M4E7_9LEPT|nr:CsgG/HfaB family protein [Leptospira paudalimensis]MCW7503260.1 CsgG/HfaB family protein [Leptospira paudalimensis]
MKQYLAFFSLLLSVSLTNCRTMDAAIQYPESGKSNLGITKVAVLIFDIEEAKWGDEFTDAVSLQIAKSLPFKVIEREQLSKVVNEQSFSKTGIIDTQTAVRIGKVLGVDALVFGRGSALKKFDDKGKLIPNLVDTVSLKIVHIESGQVIVNARKKPGADWTMARLLQYTLGLGLIWSREDILVATSQYDFVAESLVDRIVSELNK